MTNHHINNRRRLVRELAGANALDDDTLEELAHWACLGDGQLFWLESSMDDMPEEAQRFVEEGGYRTAHDDMAVIEWQYEDE